MSIFTKFIQLFIVVVERALAPHPLNIVELRVRTCLFRNRIYMQTKKFSKKKEEWMSKQVIEQQRREREKKKHERGEKEQKLRRNLFFFHFAQLIYNVDDIFLDFSAFILY